MFYDNLYCIEEFLMIKPLLEYQNKEREKLALLSGVEGGRAKREFNDATNTIENAKRMLLNLENDAKVLLNNYESISKNLGEIFDKVSVYNKNANKSTNEEEANEQLSFISGLLSKVSAYEAQLNDISNKINIKTNAFEQAKMDVVKSQKIVAGATAAYENEKKAAEPKLEKIEAELKTLGVKVTPALLEKYKSIRKSKQQGDIVVILNGNRCGGCHFELPLSLIHKVSNQGYIVCEECGKIIYKS